MNKETIQWLKDFAEIPHHFHRTDGGDMLNILEDMAYAIQQALELHQANQYGECVQCTFQKMPCATRRTLGGEQE